ncbi:MAG: putative regulatory protein, FmdB family [Dehalococcoidia bacterium]|nr:putative regulatory protein, FmdB family [Dehalococcoidia bacterium]
MPTYEYECGSCHHRFELRQGFDAEPVESCPLCQGMSRRRFHAPVIIYKGSGFYTTDYARKNYSPPSGEEDGEKPHKEKEPSSKEE